MARRAALAVRRPDDGRYLLVSTRDGRWTLPKGARAKGELPAAAALREAAEEAGVADAVLTGRSVVYRHQTAGGQRQKVVAFQADLGRLRRPARAERWRRRRWVSAAEAARDPQVPTLLATALAALEETACADVPRRRRRRSA